MRNALVSVSDKTGLEHLGRALQAHGYRILSTGGTFRFLQDNGIAVDEVSTYTGFPEIMDGRVKTLHPKLFGGILGRRQRDQSVMAEHQIESIDLVVVNLYPFEQTVARSDVERDEILEMIDIGGPSLIRAAAKNHREVLVVVDPSDYESVVERISHESLDSAFLEDMAAKAFRHTAAYDAAIAHYLTQDPYPETLTVSFDRQATMRYGENPHQSAALYRNRSQPKGAVSSLVQIQGRELSYNNISDTNAAVTLVSALSEPACVIVKHANPCGVAVADNIHDAYQEAFKTDPTSAYGGVIAVNRALTDETLTAIIDQQFAEVVVAPDIDAEAADKATRRKNLRLLRISGSEPLEEPLHIQTVDGGILVQQLDQVKPSAMSMTVVTKRQPSEAEYRDLRFCWIVAAYTKSNAIVLARDLATIGIGAGQASRVVSVKIASLKAADEGLSTDGTVLASDAFFPFRDGVDIAADTGVRAIIQPGGSIRDEEVIAAADEHGMAMVFTGVRHFRH